MRSLLVAATLVVFAGPIIAAQSGAPAAMTADAIMTKVAANQDRTEAARMRYIYMQHIRITDRKSVV